jgi:hypothetical protein
MQEPDGSVRTSLRIVLWKDWKNCKIRVKELHYYIAISISLTNKVIVAKDSVE